MAAALQALEQVGAAEAHQALAGAGQVAQDFASSCVGGWSGVRLDVVAQAVARQVEQP